MQLRPPGARPRARLRPPAPASKAPQSPRLRWWRSGPALGLYGAVAGALVTLLVGGIAYAQAERNQYIEQRVTAYAEMSAALAAIDRRPHRGATSGGRLSRNEVEALRPTGPTEIDRDFDKAFATVQLVGSPDYKRSLARLTAAMDLDENGAWQFTDYVDYSDLDSYENWTRFDLQVRAARDTEPVILNLFWELRCNRDPASCTPPD